MTHFLQNDQGMGRKTDPPRSLGLHLRQAAFQIVHHVIEFVHLLSLLMARTAQKYPWGGSTRAVESRLPPSQSGYHQDRPHFGMEKYQICINHVRNLLNRFPKKIDKISCLINIDIQRQDTDTHTKRI